MVSLRSTITWYLALTMVVPWCELRAYEGQATSPEATLPTVFDVRVGSDGKLRGQLYSAEGVPQPKVQVALHVTQSRVTQTVSTDAQGRFELDWAGNGVAVITADGGSCALRIWDSQTAPPAARDHLLLVVASKDVVRGQRPIGHLFGSNPVMLGVLIAAAIAIPLAIHESGDRPAASN